jgi:hypothetical protein
MGGVDPVEAARPADPAAGGRQIDQTASTNQLWVFSRLMMGGIVRALRACMLERKAW